MRAATLAHPSVVSAANARAALGKLALAVLATLALLFVWRPTVVHAQNASAHRDAAPADTASTVHVVKAGESLWGLAERYYGDGHQWQALATRNALTPARGRILLVGMKLKVPAKAPAARVAKAAQATAGSAKGDDTVPAYVRAAAVAPANSAGTSAPAAPASAGATPSATGSSLSAQTADKGDAAPAASSAPPSARAPRTASTRVAYGASRREPVASRPVAKPAVKSDAPRDVASRDAAAGEAAPDSGRTFGLRASRQSETLMARKTTRIGLVDREDLDAARNPKEATTVFLRHVPEAAEVDAQARAMSYADRPTPRRGEYEAAPFSIELGAIAKGGRVRHRVGAPTGALIESQQRVTLADEVEISAPAGLTLAAGDRLVVLQEIAPVGKKKGPVVVVPTGILQILPTAAGKPLRAIVQKQTGNIEQGQLLLPVEGSAVAPSVKAASAASDVETTVRWLDAAESLPTLQSYLLLGAGRTQGVQAGDEFELHTPRAAGNTGDERIARVRIVRVGATESTGIIVAQERADIVVGVPARRVARVP